MVVIPKSVNPKRIADNFKATQVLLDADEIKRIRAIDKNTRLHKVSSLFCSGIASFKFINKLIIRSIMGHAGSRAWIALL